MHLPSTPLIAPAERLRQSVPFSFVYLLPTHKTLKSGFGFKLSEYGWGSAIIGKIKGATSGQHHELATSLLRQSSSQHRQAGRAVSPLGELSLRRLG
jgi:hypothetical protein